MKTNILIAIMLSLFFSCCKSASNKTSTTDEKQTLEGEWELNYIKFSGQSLQELYSRGMPFVKFDLQQNIISGKNGCNSFTGKMNISGNKIDFNGPMTATKMYCGGQGEPVFMQNLAKTELFSISIDGKILEFTENDVLLMSFVRK